MMTVSEAMNGLHYVNSVFTHSVGVEESGEVGKFVRGDIKGGH